MQISFPFPYTCLLRYDYLYFIFTCYTELHSPVLNSSSLLFLRSCFSKHHLILYSLVLCYVIGCRQSSVAGFCVLVVFFSSPLNISLVSNDGKCALFGCFSDDQIHTVKLVHQ